MSRCARLPPGAFARPAPSGPPVVPWRPTTHPPNGSPHPETIARRRSAIPDVSALPARHPPIVPVLDTAAKRRMRHATILRRARKAARTRQFDEVFQPASCTCFSFSEVALIQAVAARYCDSLRHVVSSSCSLRLRKDPLPKKRSGRRHMSGFEPGQPVAPRFHFRLERTDQLL